MNAAVILAAGSSSRMGEGLKKEFFLYNGKPLLYFSVKTFLDSGLFSHVLITCRADLLEETQVLLKGLFDEMGDEGIDFSALEFTSGGKSRQKSVLNSLDYLSSYSLDTVLIHDGARPFVSMDTIGRVLSKVKESRACIPVEPATNTMKMINEDGCITSHLNRNFTRGAQTPQGFEFSPLRAAHLQLAREGRLFTDDSEIWDLFVGPVYTVEGNRENQKITYPGDLKVLGIDLPGDLF